MAAKRIALGVVTLLVVVRSSPNVSSMNVSISSLPPIDVGLLHHTAGEADVEQAASSLKGAEAAKFLGNLAVSKTVPSAEGDSSMLPSRTAAKDLSTSESMEAAITDLMLGKGAISATPMGASIMTIKDLIVKTMIPNVESAHSADQRLLNRLVAELSKCGKNKEGAFSGAKSEFGTYKENSRLHKRCRSDEAVRFASKQSCLVDQESRFKIKVLKCKAFAAVSRQLGTTKNNAGIVNKGGGESVESYVRRLSATFCGKHVHGNRGTVSKPGGWGGGLDDGFLDKYLKSKEDCHKATKAYHDKVKECKKKAHAYNVRKSQCNQYQTIMDAASCKRAVLVKDACESYAGCYHARRKALRITESKVRFNERDRKAEWRGLKRMECLINSFADGAVKKGEVDTCKKKAHSTDHLSIKFPQAPGLVKCAIPTLYPSTGSYKRAEFAPLPALAKGKQSQECSGVQEIGTTPMKNSPKTCKCRRITLNGFYSPGPLVKCEGCNDISRSLDTSSCPRGTKLFAPATRADWKTFLSSARPLRDPNWIIDVTSPLNSCGGCTSNAMNSKSKKQSDWVTQDGSPWWLRSTKYSGPSGDYAANCFMDLTGKPSNANSITFNDKGCSYHSKSYYCQPLKLHLKPSKGSPNSCKCSQVDLAGSYSPGALVKCEQCISVSKTMQKNSCPDGMKIFSPRTRKDWRTFLKSAGPLRAPHWIIDITRPNNGCGGCSKYAMKSTSPNQATWRTSDKSAWWLRDQKYVEPKGDYSANCYMDLNKVPTSEATISFDANKCKYRSRSYYCQPIYKKQPKIQAPPPETERRLVAWSALKQGMIEKVFYFKQGYSCPELSARNPNLMRRVGSIKYPETKGKFKGLARSNDFAMSWDFYLIIKTPGTYTFYLTSSDGSKMTLNGKSIVKNDGRHTTRTAFGSVKLVKGQHRAFVTMFEEKGAAAMKVIYKGPDTDGKSRYIKDAAMYERPQGFKEEVFYMKKLTKLPALTNKAASMQRVKPQIIYAETKKSTDVWPGFRMSHDFAVRWTGSLSIVRKGLYRWSLISDDGSRLLLKQADSGGWKTVVNNDGRHSLKNKEANYRAPSGDVEVKIEYFQHDGRAGMVFRYMGPDTRDKMVHVPKKVMLANI